MILGAVLLLAGLAQQGAAPEAAERIVKAGEPVPDAIRPCIDYVGRGALAFRGYDLIDDPDDLIGHAVYRWRFREAEPLVGRWGWRDRVLGRAAHAFRTDSYPDAVVFVARKEDGQARWVSWEWVWSDMHGRDFIPVLRWPEPNDRGLNWMPDAARRFARPVSYAWPQPYWSGLRLAAGDDEEGLVETRHGITRVLYGIYLSDLPAVFAAARPETCWR